ncbi:hypothetical protein HT136_13785 [Novosphingobium profundi]|uniref:DUF1570 domain-containing protein n=1 Tax=Novosphingobium profundi TaxID=1774954 RepID=UPI001BDAF0F8|nr:DUF1570 domain-containing protein [Novosphingobium profundi]MBT0669436.1 hypothetical protein [Novosphingobium profundi]
MRSFIFGAVLAAGLWPCAVSAQWYKASSDHFVVYAQDSERDLRTFAERLERFHSAMALVLHRKADVPSPSNRVTIFVVSSEREVRRLYQGDSKYVNGFYVPRAGNSLAIVPTITSTAKEPDESMLTLMHEYAHHFLLSAQGYAIPRWVSEGSAEFFASTTFLADGGLQLGRAAQHRGGELYFAAEVTAEQLLDPELYAERRRKGYDAFYGKSWLLYHYLTFSEARAGQLATYLTLLTKGVGERAAAEQAFGDFKVLDKELDRYLQQRRILSFRLGAEQLSVGSPVMITPLSEGEAESLPLRIQSQRGVDQDQAKEVVSEARALAMRFPEDAWVLSELAEAENDVHERDAAIAAADRAIARDPANVNAYLQKGYALFAKAHEASGKDMAAAYAAARKPFVALNRIENDHPLPLVYYYRSYADQGVKPPELAVDGLVRASELAPFDLGLQMTVGTTLLALGETQAARVHLQPVAYNPHGGSMSRSAQALVDKISSDPGWKGEDMAQVLARAQASEEGDGPSEAGDGGDGEATGGQGASGGKKAASD